MKPLPKITNDRDAFRMLDTAISAIAVHNPIDEARTFTKQELEAIAWFLESVKAYFSEKE